MNFNFSYQIKKGGSHTRLMCLFDRPKKYLFEDDTHLYGPLEIDLFQYDHPNKQFIEYIWTTSGNLICLNWENKNKQLRYIFNIYSKVNNFLKFYNFQLKIIKYFNKGNIRHKLIYNNKICIKKNWNSKYIRY